MCIDQRAAFALCINVIVCVCAATPPEAIRVFFCIYMWLVCWCRSRGWTAHSCIYRWSPWSSETLLVFADSWPAWRLYPPSVFFFLFMFVFILFHFFPIFCFNSKFYIFLLFSFIFPLCSYFSNFLLIFYHVPSLTSSSLSPSCPSVSVSRQSVGLAWTTPPSYHPGPPWFLAAVKVLEGSAAASWEGAWDTTAATRPSPTPSTTWPSCRRPTRRSWNQSSTATAPWRSWVSRGDGEGCRRRVAK